MITEKIHETMLGSFVEIKFKICSIYEAECAERNSSLKSYRTISRDAGYKPHTQITGRITEQFCEMLTASLSLRRLLEIR